MSQKEIFAEGFNLNFFPSAEFEELNASNPEENYLIQAKNFLRIIMMGWQESWSKLLNWESFQAIFIARDYNLTKALRLAFQEGFNYLFQQLKDTNLSPEQHRQVEFFIANCLTLLPYSDPTPYEAFSIPQWINNNWQLVEYKITPIELTPTSGFKKLFLAEDDRVFAYGLEPINNPHAEPHLIFMGTTYPAGQGFTTQVNTDLEAFETAGKKLYRTGRKRISAWLDRQDKKVHVCGTSLGGALSLLLAIDQGERISRVDALNPPGLYNSWRKSQYDNWDSCVDKPPVYIQKQKDDPISLFGIWKKEWQILCVTPPKEREGPNAIAAHALNYAGFATTTFKLINAEEDNRERETRNFWMYSLLRSLFYYVFLVPYRYLILPILRFAANHKLQLVFFIPLFMLFYMFPPLGLGLTALLTLNAICSALISSYILQGFVKYLAHFFTERWGSGLADFIKLMHNYPLLEAASYMLSGIFILTIIAIGLINPFMVVPIMLVVASIPLIINILAAMIKGIAIWGGLNKIEAPDCQSPLVMRNEALDIYRHTINASFSIAEVRDYYFVRRCLLKDKVLIPEEKLEAAKNNKSQLLKLSGNEKNQHLSVNIKASKAKIHHMHQIIQAVKRFGFHASEEFLAIEKGYKEGKLSSKSNIEFELPIISISPYES